MQQISNPLTKLVIAIVSIGAVLGLPWMTFFNIFDPNAGAVSGAELLIGGVRYLEYAIFHFSVGNLMAFLASPALSILILLAYIVLCVLRLVSGVSLDRFIQKMLRFGVATHLVVGLMASVVTDMYLEIGFWVTMLLYIALLYLEKNLPTKSVV